MPLASKMLLQIAAQDIGQLTDIDDALAGRRRFCPVIAFLSVTRPPLRGVLTLNKRFRDSSDAWCEQLPDQACGLSTGAPQRHGWDIYAAFTAIDPVLTGLEWLISGLAWARWPLPLPE
jgi:hypothetical protein